MSKLNEFIQANIPGEIQVSSSSVDTVYRITTYSPTECKRNEHKYFINNMSYYAILNILTNILNRMEIYEMNDPIIHSSFTIGRPSEQKYFLKALMDSDIKDSSVYMADGFITRQQVYYDDLEVEEINTCSIKRLKDLSFHEFVMMYQKIQSYEEKYQFNNTLSMTAKEFEWKGI